MVHMTTEMDEDEIAELAKKSPRIAPEKLEEMVAFISGELKRMKDAYLDGRS